MANTTSTGIRITKAMKFNAILCALQGKDIPHDLTISDLEDFILHECDLLVKKNTSDKKPTKTQQENISLKERVVTVVAGLAKPVTISDIQAADEVLGDMSNQKISAMVRQLVDSGNLVRTEEKRKAFFTVA